ncbi:hypothetical protein Q8A67_006303 [Cirrhinus molitorella]|uniref:Uncharacterized protein n=1 Tax=Cirrhinus molitorella TaxID=172907 RepID=A0AA88PXP7_9TELE|nr:hypothetical protein Q8A67_006303 [Cirrhinus molitorella]
MEETGIDATYDGPQPYIMSHGREREARTIERGIGAEMMGRGGRCSCGHCEPMPSAVESMCCRKVDAYWSLVQQLVPPIDIPCLTLHPGFDACCLNLFSLQVAYLTFHQEHGPLRTSRAE